MRSLTSQLRYTIRLLLKSPGFTITAILILGFGIGANTAVFNLINCVLLKPLPYPHADRLVSMSVPIDTSRTVGADLPDFLDYRASQQSFTEIAAIDDDFVDLSGSDGPQRIVAGFVSAGLFKVTGRDFLLGRPFTEKEDQFGGSLVVVLAERFWRSHLHSDPAVLGRNLILGGRSFEVIGVCPQQVDDWGFDSTDLYVPIHSMARPEDSVWRRDSHFLSCCGRLKPGVSMEQAQADLDIIRRKLVEQYPETNRGYGVALMPLLDSMVEDNSNGLWLIGGSVSCLLIIALANVANLLFCRAIERQKEMTIRRALGATRLSLAGQALIESSILSIVGAALGLLIAFGLIRLMRAICLQENLARVDNIGFDGSTLIFFLCMTGLVALLSGSLPAMKAIRKLKHDPLNIENSRSATAGPGRQRTQRVLVIGQVALSCILVIAAGLLIRSFIAAQSRPLGFNPDRLLAAEISLTDRKYDDPARTREFFSTVLAGVRNLPGVSDVAMNEDLPFNRSWSYHDPFLVPGKPAPAPGHEPRLASQRISPGYFRTLQIPLLRGRDFGSEDTPTSSPVIIIDQALASRYFPNEDPIGKQIENTATWSVSKFCTIVGVAGNVLHVGPDNEHAAFDAYFPHSQQPMTHEVLVLRLSADPSSLAPAIRKIISVADPDVPVVKVKGMDDLIAERSESRKTGTLWLTMFSGAALFLSALGIYGTLSYSVLKRSREMGIRISLGATSAAILRLILRDSMRTVTVGLLVGMIIAASLTKVIQNALYGVSPADPIAIGVSVTILIAVALIASLIPAARAARVNPTTALRNE
ncbi:MAG: ABC transporter permease [Verrucomicrobia bacterium]|nr:ABC transporter permease [Verrucomicrobiota bacterium]